MVSTMLIDTLHSALEDRKKAFDSVGVNCTIITGNILTNGVLNYTTISKDDQPFFCYCCLGFYKGMLLIRPWRTGGYFKPVGLKEGGT